MATRPDVEAALASLAERLAGLDPALRRRYLVDRTVCCRVSDLGVAYAGRLCEQGLVDVHPRADRYAQVLLSLGSDDLVALTAGRLTVPVAWATGRLRVQAAPLDMLRLRTLL